MASAPTRRSCGTCRRIPSSMSGISPPSPSPCRNRKPDHPGVVAHERHRGRGQHEQRHLERHHPADGEHGGEPGCHRHDHDVAGRVRRGDPGALVMPIVEVADHVGQGHRGEALVHRGQEGAQRGPQQPQHQPAGRCRGLAGWLHLVQRCDQGPEPCQRRAPAREGRGAHRARSPLASPVSTAVSADRPGIRRAPSGIGGTRTIFTGTRCTTLVKLPVARSAA